MNISDSLTRTVQDFFRTHLISRRAVSPNTISAYRDTLRMLLSFAASRTHHTTVGITLDDLGRDTVLAFLDYIEKDRHNSPSTRNSRLAAVQSFFRFVSEEDPTSINVSQRVLAIPYKRLPAPLVTCLDREEIEHILKLIDRTKPAGRRDAALLHFLYNTGARAQEVVDLQLPSVRLATPAQVRIMGKGRKERLCPLWHETGVLIKDMLMDRGVELHQDVPLFVSTIGRPLTRFGLGHIIRMRVASAASTMPSLAKKKITPHTFRHSTALHLLQSGVEINMVRSWLGHASIETTHSYVEIDMRMKIEALKACQAVKTTKGRPRWMRPDLLTWLETL